MKIISTKVYTFDELSDKAKETARERYRNAQTEIPWQDETIESLKVLLKVAGIRLLDWSLGAYNQDNHIKIEIPGEPETGALSGGRAMAWLENNLLGKLRV
jgi:hypothetical protein